MLRARLAAIEAEADTNGDPLERPPGVCDGRPTWMPVQQLLVRRVSAEQRTHQRSLVPNARLVEDALELRA